ncbi:MAG TPA: hypothetical protein DEA75_15395 [Rhodobacteraceae bacterium]|nr:hypothetical protein [Paracoccaceae bacterium]
MRSYGILVLVYRGPGLFVQCGHAALIASAVVAPVRLGKVPVCVFKARVTIFRVYQMLAPSRTFKSKP